MFGLKHQEPQKHVVEHPEFRDLVRNQVLIICNMSVQHAALQVPSVLGLERMHMDIEVCSRVIGLLVEQQQSRGAVFETKLDLLYTVGGRREYAKSIVKAMSSVRRNVVSDVPEERLYKSLGEIIRVGRSLKGPNGEKPEIQYAAKEGAYDFELTYAWNAGRKRAAEYAARASMDNDTYAPVLRNMPAGVPFGEHVRNCVRAYHKRQDPDLFTRQAR